MPEFKTKTQKLRVNYRMAEQVLRPWQIIMQNLLPRVLEATAQANKERVAQEEFTRDALTRKAVEQVVGKFKQSEEYPTILDTQHDASYDLGVEEIFFNIWRKHRDVNYKFLGIKLLNLMTG